VLWRRTMRSEVSGPLARKRLAFSSQAPLKMAPKTLNASHLEMLREGPAVCRRARVRVRPHTRFRNRGTDSLRESGMKWVGGGTTRHCDRTPAEVWRCSAIRTSAEPERGSADIDVLRFWSGPAQFRAVWSSEPMDSTLPLTQLRESIQLCSRFNSAVRKTLQLIQSATALICRARARHRGHRRAARALAPRVTVSPAALSRSELTV
jgi:hypothetical protein